MRVRTLIGGWQHEAGYAEDEREREASVPNGDREVGRPAADHAVHNALGRGG